MNGVVAAVVVAAGRGFRAGSEGPKQYREIGGEPVIRSSLKGLAGHPGIAMVQPVIHRDDAGLFQAAAAGLDVLEPVFGGATRQASVRAGLEALSPRRPDLVLVHDAARPFASAALIARGIAAARACGAAIPALPIADTVKTVDPSGAVTGTIERAQLRLVQTPQAFTFATLLAAHRRARAAGREDFTDDAALAEWAGIKVGTFEGEAANVKLTTADDFVRAGVVELAALTDVRTGFGYDVHAFGAGDHLTLGGVRIAHLDVNVVCEAPRIGPHRDTMRMRIAEIAGIDVTRVAVKATTSEKLGFIGRSEGMAAFATATVRLPWKE